METGGGTRLGMLTNSASGVGEEEGRRRRRGRNTAELNRNQNRTPDQIPTYLPPIILSNPCRRRRRLFQRHVGKGGGRMTGRHAWKQGVAQRRSKKSTDATSDRPLLAVITDDGGGGDSKKSPKSGEREAFVGGGGRRDNICVSASVLVGGEDQWRRGPRQRSGAKRS